MRFAVLSFALWSGAFGARAQDHVTLDPARPDATLPPPARRDLGPPLGGRSPQLQDEVLRLEAGPRDAAASLRLAELLLERAEVARAAWSTGRRSR